MESRADFEWDARKNSENQRKHGVSFDLAQLAFLDEHRVIMEDLSHIIGAGYWRKGKRIYEKEN